MKYYRWNKPDLILYVRIQSNACRDEFSEILPEAIKIRITALPIDGKANKHLIKFLANKFKVPKGNVTILQGKNSSRKKISIHRPSCVPLPLILTELEL